MKILGKIKFLSFSKEEEIKYGMKWQRRI